MNKHGPLLRRLARSGISGATSVSTGDLLRALKSLPNTYEGGRQILARAGETQVFGLGANSTSSREIFANSEVHLDKIKVVGFDYDFTLASYTTHLQRFIFSEALQHLVDKKRYPSSLLDKTEYDKSFAVRGLTFDKERGLLCKLGPNFKVDLTSVFRGRKRLDEQDALKAFGGVSHLRSTNSVDALVGIFDQFSLAEACLLADVCEYFYKHDISFSPAAVYQDVSSSISFVHRSGMMHSAVMNNVEKYLHKGPKLRELLVEMRDSKVDTFILSNSSFDYIDVGMRYICGEDWMSLFTAVLTDAEKPSFYSSRNPFRQIDIESPLQGKDEPRRIKWSQVTSIKPMCAYSKGNVTDLMNLTGWKGPEVLYIGDHVFADLRNPARFQGWWTGAIIRELEKEIDVERKPEFQYKSFKMQLIEEIMRRVQWAPVTDADVPLPGLLDSLEFDRATLRREMNDLINENFGSVFISSAHNPSLFSSYMERYCDLYTSRLENFLEYGMSYRFYPRRRRTLAHEPPVPSVANFLQSSLNRTVNRRDINIRQELSFIDWDEEESEDPRTRTNRT